MAWIDRLKEAAYTSPSGVRLVFLYEDVRRAFVKKASAFEFPDADSTFVQDLGASGRRYPVRAIFSGADCDLEADVFELALRESGVGKLEHPRYGMHDVIPFGEVSQRDFLVTAANQVIIEVVFWETTGIVYPTAQSDPASAVLTAVDEYNTAAAETFATTPGLDSATGQASLKSQYEVQLAAVSSALTPIAETQEEVAAQFLAIEDSINLGIDVLIEDPITLAFQTILLIQTPARAAAAIADRLNAYASLLSSLVTEGNATGVQEFGITDLFASTQVAAMIVSVVDNEFLTKSGAIAAAEIILGQMAVLTIWRDDTFETLEAIDTGEAYQQLQEAVAIAAGFLVELSFSLKQERFIVLDSPRTIIDLVAELYGAIDDAALDFFISSNNLTGSEILEVGRGRKIVFYV